jgi:hypothetical protein
VSAAGPSAERLHRPAIPEMPWFKRFPDPIILANGRELLTLSDAAAYITELSKTERDSAEWLIATEALTLAAETDAPPILARTAVLNAINRNEPRAAARPRTAKIFRIFGKPKP